MHFTLEIKCVTENVMCMEDNLESCDYIVLSLRQSSPQSNKKQKPSKEKKQFYISAACKPTDILYI